MKIGDLKKIINSKDLDDDFEVKGLCRKLIPEDQRNDKYPFPYEYFKGNLEFCDTGYLDKVIVFSFDHED